MKTINQKSESNQLNKERPWLEKHYTYKRNRTIELVKNSVDLLVSKDKEVTISNIAQISKQIDPENKGIHPNTIRVNTEAHDYYSKHSKTYQKVMNRSKQQRKNKKPISTENFENIKPNRNLVALQNRYKNLTKEDLISRLIGAEEYIVENNQKWLYKQFIDYPIEF
ncbi:MULTISPECIES: hypothetical protein [Lysinibacillus]|uniref:Uncharacterized protein n=3 Tax=Lysinibacillus TaxID=400634 RepID=W7S341_LYSSH|nr:MULTISPECIES: hypothetical protein [Lysinibacillus]EWH32656.1 hypothetical protein P799_11225 [Lysinibacillus sphaericus CBAM5]MBG9711475.1 hypothetical protein [Lysinibacillus sphaericus]MBG9727549.1 hypothetical protein [Lysinibacillus fusiformis]MBG9731739.1 hypothetical protein [Lysinibacillus sphaericus]MBG9740052.1 hypothetical protein [Lysinibacillus sphaericus]